MGRGEEEKKEGRVERMKRRRESKRKKGKWGGRGRRRRGFWVNVGKVRFECFGGSRGQERRG